MPRSGIARTGSTGSDTLVRQAAALAAAKTPTASGLSALAISDDILAFLEANSSAACSDEQWLALQATARESTGKQRAGGKPALPPLGYDGL